MTAVPAPPVMSELRVTLIGALLIAIGPISMALYTPAMPILVSWFQTTQALVKLTVTVYFAGFAAAQLVCGPLSDGIGRRPVILGFMAVYLAACVMILFAETIHTMLAARFLQGVGAAMGIAIARAIVRDVFADSRAVRIMNLMGLFIAIAPAIAPTIGGLTLEVAPWQALFGLMALMGLAVIWVTLFQLRETVVADVSRIRPRALLQSYRSLLTTPYFVLASLVVACAIGAVYSLATLLPFVLMDQVGMSPTAFGVSQILQAGAFVVGASAVQALLPRVAANNLVPAGLIMLLAASAALAGLIVTLGASFLNVMLPIALFSVGVAFIMPAMLTNSLMPFPRMAGAASALTAFLQMVAGLAASALAALFRDPAIALASIVPGMAVLTAASWLFWRRLPDPRSANTGLKDDQPPKA